MEQDNKQSVEQTPPPIPPVKISNEAGVSKYNFFKNTNSLAVASLILGALSFSFLIFEALYSEQHRVIALVLPMILILVGIVWVYKLDKDKVAISALIIGLLIFLFFINESVSWPYYHVNWPICALLWPLTIVICISGIIKSHRVKKGMGMVGVGLGMTLFILCIFVFGIFSRPGCWGAMSMTNLNGIGKAMELYSSANDDKMPTSLELLIEDGYGSTNMFENPRSRGNLEIVDGKFTGEMGYVYFLDKPLELKNGKVEIRGYEKTKYALFGKVGVLMTNGKVKSMTIEELNKQLIAEGRPPAE